MNHFTKTLGLVVLGALVGGSLLGCAGSAAVGSDKAVAVERTTAALNESVCPPGVPTTLRPAAGQTLKQVLSGVGLQVYMCAASANGTLAWQFIAPQANLNDDGKLIGTHFIGPTWQSNDGSSVVGQKVAAATLDATAIPWLLLNGISHSSQAGRFSDVTSVQRLSTVGGIAPAEGCDTAHVGAIAQVPYTAEYVFYKAKAGGDVHVCGG